MSFTFDGSGNAVLASGGTAASPAIRINNSTNSGIFAAENSGVAWSVGGTERFSVRPGRTLLFNDLVPLSYREAPLFMANSGSSRTLNARSLQSITLSENCTFTLPPSEGNSGRGITLMLKTGSGGNSATFTSADGAIKWPNGVSPTVTQAANKMDIFCFMADGTNWYGSAVQNYSI